MEVDEVLEQALKEQEEAVDALIKVSGKYVAALKAWKKACQAGNVGSLVKASGVANEISMSLPETTGEAKSAWTYDVRAYLGGSDWLRELEEAADRAGLRTLDQDGALVSSPVTVRSAPGRNAVVIGKVNWTDIRPQRVAAELKRLRDKTLSANSQEFAESLHAASVYLSDKANTFARFRDIYDLFCLTPGYKRENPTAAFGQQIYAMQRAGIVTTRAGRKIGIEYASGNAKEKDLFSVTSEDNRMIRYYSIWFK